jgi:uroporphyrinogen-III synthase
MPSFGGLRVLALESRRAREIGALIENYGGRAIVAPALREVPLSSNPEALEFADGLVRGGFDVVILLTGVGARALLDVVQQKHPPEVFIAALAKTKVVARGPKPLAVLREWNVPAWVTAPEPNTWREVLGALDATAEKLNGKRVAVQEYGVGNRDLLSGLEERGATVTRVPVYKWALPEDSEPLKAAAHALARGEVDVVLLTTGTQLLHLLQVAADLSIQGDVRRGLARVVVASIGPTTSEELRQQGIQIDLEASHPKMGFLVREAAERSAELTRSKRAAGLP